MCAAHAMTVDCESVYNIASSPAAIAAHPRCVGSAACSRHRAATIACTTVAASTLDELLDTTPNVGARKALTSSNAPVTVSQIT